MSDVPQYLLLSLPSTNRVYAEAATRLSVAELSVLNRAVLNSRLWDIGTTAISGVDYLSFAAEELDDRDVRLLSNLSSAYALYAVVDGDLLRPMTVRRLDRFDDDLLTIQKYPGKTNEQFTKLLLNVTLWSSRFGAQMLDRRLLVTDPLCGRGTTLNQALTYGYDASGIDIDTKDFEAYSTFMQTYVKRKRLKHQAAVVRVKRDGRVTGRRFDLTLAESKDRYRAGNTVTLSVINADTTSALEFLPRGRSDVLVTDAPYGVQHASRTSHRGDARSPLDLLTAALPTWVDLLRSGGALGVAWNVHVARREDAAAVLTDAGLRVCDEGPYREFGHRVDQAITRDIIVAVKP